MEDLTIREMTNALGLAVPLAESIVKHTLVILGEPNHECENEDPDFNDLPDFDDDDLRAFLAFEQSAVEQFVFMRKAFIAAGYTELMDEVTS